ncbi:hypothetical protein GJ744_002495 [Endocarpon pusillum]|uniref:Uncharacterized protein n=1 Tax=Endocarpon pusillum TaxID=364733 RepID=A0A8H7ABX2_9EURO|nr:hypothetical protein GJ744_002495 [Endocarpon pusillum]
MTENSDARRADAATATAPEADMAKAFQELARGEQTASALESRLTEVERRIDQLLASVQESTHQVEHHHPDHLPKENGNSSKDAERQ